VCQGSPDHDGLEEMGRGWRRERAVHDAKQNLISRILLSAITEDCNTIHSRTKFHGGKNIWLVFRKTWV